MDVTNTTFGVGIITYNTAHLLLDCVRSLVRNDVALDQIFVIDSCSTDDTALLMKEQFPDVSLTILKENRGYAYAVNRAVEIVHSDLMLIINADTYFKEGTIKSLLTEVALLSDGGVYGVQQVYSDGSWQRSYGLLPSLKLTLNNGLFITFIINFFNSIIFKFLPRRKPFVVGYIDGAILLFRKEVFYQLGGFDESFFFYGEEADFCARMHQHTQFKPYLIPTVTVTHFRGKSSQKVGGNNEFYIKNLYQGIIRCASKYSNKNQLYTIRDFEVFFSKMKLRFFTFLRYVVRSDFVNSKVEYYTLVVRTWVNMNTFIDAL